MAKRPRNNGKKAQKGRAKEGRGVGLGSDYKPYLYIHDVPSIGLVSRVWGWKTGRVHHCLSRLELKFFYTREWCQKVIDIREQFPLDLDETLAIADQLGVRHPRDPKTKDYVVMTSDFVITESRAIGSEDIIRTTKYKAELQKSRVMEKLKIEEVYWQDIRGMDWDVVTEDDFSSILAANVEWIHGHREIESLTPLTVSDVYQIELMLSLMLQGDDPLRDLTNECDERLSLNPGSSLSVVRYLIANRRLDVDMERRIIPCLPLALITNPLNATMLTEGVA